MEVATKLGVSLLSSTFSWLLSKLDSNDLSELLNSHKHVRKEVPKWRNFLPKIQAVLEDAEQKQAANELVKLYLDDLRDLAFDMEDILDELELDAKRKLIASPKACPSITHILTPKWVKDREIASQMKKITARLPYFEGKIENLGLMNLAANVEASSSQAVAERSHNSAMPDPRVVGRKSDTEKIFQMFNDEGNHEGYSVVPIVGMGGLGKTTLAGLIYNDYEKFGFEKRAWACVSEAFDVYQITRDILQQVTEEKPKKEDLFSLQQELKKNLSGKKFLLVLDDIWIDEKNDRWYKRWDELQRPFLDGAPGSKIIVTTRDMVVAENMRADDKVYKLDFLPNDECLSLFARHALDEENFDSHQELEGVGREIVEKCRGLPLAVKVLGGLLRGKPYHQQWEDLLNHELCNLPERQSGIYAVLKLSYNRLPHHLKQCFGFCALLPKDYEFDKNELVLLWMAAGFLQQQSQGMKEMHDLGHQCFDDLLSRSIFQPSVRDRSLFMMHDFVSDLAQEVAGEICCSLDQLGPSDNKVRHLSFAPRHCDVLKRFEVLKEKKNLRTLLQLKWDKIRFSYLSKEVAVGILPKLKCLRVLSLCRVKELPNSIGDLKHLRYMDLSHSSIRSLPESVGSLLFLQTLILHDCAELTRLPATIGHLIDLHYLDLTNTRSLTEIPLEVAKLKSLVLLTKFILGKADSGLRLKELKNLTSLQGRLSISNLHNLLEIEDAKDIKLYDMKLDDLSFEWASVCSDSQSKVKDFRVLECLKPSHRLERLTINCYGGEDFPSWIGDPSFSQLKFLELRDCQNCTSLPSLGQLPQLKELIIEGSKVATLIGDSDNFSSGVCFQELQKLKLENCCMLGKLPQGFPSLKMLLIERCPQLTYSSVSLPSLKILSIKECSELFLRSIVDLTSLTILKIFKISSLVFLPKKFLESMIALEVMWIESCEELTCLWEEGANIANLAHLRRLSIDSCPLLTSVIVELKSLVQLDIMSCPNFKLFLSGQLPATLKNLKIERCENLESLPGGLMDDNNGDNMLQLEELYLETIATRNLFPSGLLPLDHMSSLSTLTSLSIEQVEGLKSFPESGLDMPNLKFLNIADCKNLRSLPNGMHNLASLQSLRIWACHRIESIPEGGFPTSLTFLCIDGEHLKQPIKDWGLHSLTSLEKLHIGWICPPCDLLPTSLISFGIYDVKNLRSLSRELLQNLSSLQELFIHSCSVLQFLPKEGLPSSLGYLKIDNCPRLAQRLKKKQDHRRLIAHIPHVEIN